MTKLTRKDENQPEKYSYTAALSHPISENLYSLKLWKRFPGGAAWKERRTLSLSRPSPFFVMTHHPTLLACKLSIAARRSCEERISVSVPLYFVRYFSKFGIPSFLEIRLAL